MTVSTDIRLSGERTVAVIGGGPAGLMAAELLARAGANVTVYDQMASLGRKFLMAGRGGLNLTHSEDLATFLTRYDDADPLLRGAIEAFPPAALRAWSDSLGQPTFVGSSGRVFPTVLKTSPLLRTWLLRLNNLGVTFKLRHRWSGWDEEGSLRFIAAGQEVLAEPDATMLALGGASWPKLGSDARWVDILHEQEIGVTPLRPANCGFTVGWTEVFRKFEGQPLKGIAISSAGRAVRGEAMITRDGLEGGAIYVLSSPIRDAIERHGDTTIAVDLMPDVSATKLTERLSAAHGKQSLSNFLRKATHLSQAALALAARGGVVEKSVAVIDASARPRRTHQSRAAAADRRAADRYRDFDRRRRQLRCTGRRLYAVTLSGGLRRRCDARLGRPDRRLSAASLVRNRRRRRARRDPLVEDQ